MLRAKYLTWKRGLLLRLLLWICWKKELTSHLYKTSRSMMLGTRKATFNTASNFSFAAILFLVTECVAD